MAWRYWGEALSHAAILDICKISSATENITPQQSLSGSPRNNSRFPILGFAAYVPMEKEVRKAKMADHAQLVVRLGILNSLYRNNLVNANRLKLSRRGVFDERIFSIRTFKTSIVRDQVKEFHHEQGSSDRISLIGCLR